MQSPIPEYFKSVLGQCTDTSGQPADYIPELAAVDPDKLALAVTTVAGSSYDVGDEDTVFSFQSMSKSFTYALALKHNPLEDVLARVGVEPSGEAFNEISLEPKTGRPRNPMINAGAIATYDLLPGDEDERAAMVLDFYSDLAGRPMEVDEELFESEMGHAHRNLALAHLMAASEIVADPEAAVRGYIRACSVKVTAHDLAVMAATLATGGSQPVTGKRLLQPWIVRQVLSVMATCGMYDASGAWLARVGIPAKSGVSGGIIGVLPGQAGIAVFSPRLDPRGNSVRGVQVMERLSEDVGMHMMTVVRPDRSALRSVRSEEHEGQDLTVYELQGDLLFASAESVIGQVMEKQPETGAVAFDLRRVDQVSDAARRMFAELTSRLRDDDYRVILIDPDDVLEKYLDESNLPEYWEELSGTGSGPSGGV